MKLSLPTVNGLADWMGLTNSNSFRTEEAQRVLPQQFLAIDWTGASMVVTEVTHSHQGLQAGRSFRRSIDTSLEHSSQEIGAWLASLISEAKLRSTVAIVAAPRRFVAFKILTLPNLPDDRLANAVALQAEMLFPKATHDLIVDFICRPYSAQQTERSVLVAAIPREQIANIEQTLATAGLQTSAIVVGELGLGGLVPSDARLSDGCAVVSINASKIEYLIQSRGCPILSYAAKAPAADTLITELGSTLHRLMASIPLQVVDGQLQHLHLVGRDAHAIKETLQRIPNISLSITSSEDAEDQVKLNAVALAYKSSQYRIDFRAPRRARDARLAQIQQRKRWALIGGAACLLTATAGWLNSMRLEEKQRFLKSELMRLEQLVEQRRPDWERAAAVSRWQESRIDWSTSLAHYFSKLPTNDEVVLKSLEMAQVAGGAGTIDVEASAKNTFTAQLLVDQFIATPDYSQTQLKRLELKPGDNRYSADFALGITLAGGNDNAQ